MKLTKRAGAILGFLLALAGGVTAATGWLSTTFSTTDLQTGAKPVILATDDDDGTWTSIKSSTGLPTNSSEGPNVACSSYAGATTSVPAGSSGTSVDAGATGDVNWLAASNLNRTNDIEIDTDTGSIRLPPLGTVTFAKTGPAGTADNVTVVTNCTGCGGSATNVTLLACDDD